MRLRDLDKQYGGQNTSENLNFVKLCKGCMQAAVLSMGCRDIHVWKSIVLFIWRCAIMEKYTRSIIVQHYPPGDDRRIYASLTV